MVRSVQGTCRTECVWMLIGFRILRSIAGGFKDASATFTHKERGWGDGE
jgi:hypothetical protein